MAEGKTSKPLFKAVPAFFALGLIALCRVTSNWQQKSIGYYYGFKGSGAMIGDPKYEIATFYP